MKIDMQRNGGRLVIIIIIIIIKVFIESKDKNTYLMLQAIKIKNDLQY